MAAAEMLRGANAEDFFNLLKTTGMITIKCPLRDSSYIIIRRNIVVFPTELACAVSSRFRELCKNRTCPTLTFEELLKSSLRKFEICGGAQDNDVLEAFVKWLYTGEIIVSNKLLIWEVWGFAERIGAPRLQNAALKLLSRPDKSNPDRHHRFGHNEARHIANNIGLAWDEVEEYENLDNVECYSIDGAIAEAQVHKRVMFTLDCAAYQGTEWPEVAYILGKGGRLAICLAHRLIYIEKERSKGAKILPPWHPKNIKKYLVKEDLAETEVAPEETEENLDDDMEEEEEEEEDDDDDEGAGGETESDDTTINNDEMVVEKDNDSFLGIGEYSKA